MRAAQKAPAGANEPIVQPKITASAPFQQRSAIQLQASLAKPKAPLTGPRPINVPAANRFFKPIPSAWSWNQQTAPLRPVVQRSCCSSADVIKYGVHTPTPPARQKDQPITGSDEIHGNQRYVRSEWNYDPDEGDFSPDKWLYENTFSPTVWVIENVFHRSGQTFYTSDVIREQARLALALLGAQQTSPERIYIKNIQNKQTKEWLAALRKKPFTGAFSKTEIKRFLAETSLGKVVAALLESENLRAVDANLIQPQGHAEINVEILVKPFR